MIKFNNLFNVCTIKFFTRHIGCFPFLYDVRTFHFAIEGADTDTTALTNLRKSLLAQTLVAKKTLQKDNSAKPEISMSTFRFREISSVRLIAATHIMAQQVALAFKFV